jgi:hypothetical protein
LDSLPQYAKTHDLRDVERFLGKKQAAAV